MLLFFQDFSLVGLQNLKTVYSFRVHKIIKKLTEFDQYMASREWNEEEYCAQICDGFLTFIGEMRGLATWSRNINVELFEAVPKTWAQKIVSVAFLFVFCSFVH